jgi:hypothetical protein
MSPEQRSSESDLGSGLHLGETRVVVGDLAQMCRAILPVITGSSWLTSVSGSTPSVLELDAEPHPELL